MEQWRCLLQELTQVLESEFAKMQKLEQLAHGQAVKVLTDAGSPPKPMLASKPWAPTSDTPMMHAELSMDTSMMLQKAVPLLPPVAADPDRLDNNAVETITRSIKTFAAEKTQMRSASGLNDAQTHFRVVRATKTSHVLQQKPWYVINPDQSKAASRWQILVAFCLLFVALATPVQVALLEPEVDWLFFVGLGVDVVFMIDLILQFFMAYPVTTAQGITWEVRSAKIRERYLKSWFPLDILSIMPFDVLTVALEAQELRELAVLKVIRALRLVKLLVFRSRTYRVFNAGAISLTHSSGSFDL